MINTDCSWIRKDRNSKKHYIVPKPDNNFVTDLVIGMIPVIAGLGYIALSAFHNGAHAYEKAEFDVMHDLDLLKPVDEA